MELLSCNWDTAKYLIFSENVYDNLIYYSHLGPLIVSIIIGFFVLSSDKKALINKVLFLLTLDFSLWIYFDLILWASEKIDYIMFFWSMMIFLDLMIYALSFYLIYLYVKREDMPFKIKIIFGCFFVPLFFSVITKLNLEAFDYTNCDRGAIEGVLWKYTYIIEFIILLWIIFFAIKSFLKADKLEKYRIAYFSLGLVIFLFIYSVGNFMLFMDMDWRLEQYKLFGMPVFVAFLSYLIVKYREFNAKLLSAQALVIALVILTGSQFFFIQTNANRILTGITLVLVATFGWFLIKSVKLEVKRKEELQIMTDRLAQANDQLRKLDNAKSEFISIASHQLRTPLTAIKGFISLIMEGSYGKTTPKLKDVLNKVYSSNERLITLVEDMLNLSRIESGRMEYTFEKVKMEEVCQEVFDTFVIRAREKGLKFELKFPEKPISEAMIDRNKIREVISNLVDNAIKYTPKGWVYLRLSQNGDFVRVAVSDTGIGVPKDEMPYLFEKFSRGKDINHLNTGGTGLGLHVGKKIIEALHGKLDLKSEGAGKGSTFYVEVPVEAGE